MASGISLGMGFDLPAPLPIDSRMNFKTIADMAAYPEDSLPDTYMCTNDETGLLYVYAKTNSIDATLGKWRALSGSASGLEIMALTEYQVYMNGLIITATGYIDPTQP